MQPASCKVTMARDLKNKIVVITGAATGIGYEIADKYLQKDAKVAILLDIDEKQGTESAMTLCTKHGSNRSVFIKCDVTKDLEAVSKQIIGTYKNIDVLINNAGVANDELAKKTIDVNLLALIEWSMKFWEHMRTDKNGKGGTIINIASMYGIRIYPYVPIYHASKFGVMGFTKSLGHVYNFNRSGVRVLAICPGFTETNLGHDVKTFDQCIAKDFSAHAKEQLWQKVDAVGKAAVDIFEKANSGTAWLIEGAKPIEEA